jgi:hypothetical protein
MGSRLTEIVVDCHDPVAQAAFWAAALDYHVVRTEDGAGRDRALGTRTA